MRNEKGSILMLTLPVLLILFTAMGIYIFNSAQSTVQMGTNQMVQQEKDIYNEAVKQYIGENKKGSEVKQMINDIISMNDRYIDENGKFISIEADNIPAFDDTDLEDACENAYINNSQTNVADAATKMRTLSSSISSAKNYKIEAEFESGIIVKVKISENN